MQDGYIRVFENIGKLKKPESLMSWVYQVMTNVCITALKREQERVPIDDVTSEIVVPPENPFADEEVVEALQKIMPSQRLVFNLIEVDDYSIEEVAKELKCTEVNVRAC
jgi:RNA polymerase sigma-70 factor (ECF subfamily)